MASPAMSGLGGDARGLAALRSEATRDPRAAAKEAAKQFEALFMQELMKSMRAAAMQTGLFDNEASKLGTEMLDSQLATQFAGRPGGLSDLIVRQLERQMGLAPGPIPRSAAADGSPDGAAAWENTERTPRIPDKQAAAFVRHHHEAARAAEQATGIPASFMIAQAAHESGWGRREIRNADGTASHNLFGIKAGAGWRGQVAEAMTTEVVDGQPRRMVQKFRAYANYADSFADYAALMRSQPRYREVLAAGPDARGFAESLQRAGYATDPRYADKLTDMIHTTLRLQRTSG